MMHGRQTRLEDALVKTEADADALLKAVATLAVAAKKFRAAARLGNLRELRPAIASAESALFGVTEQLSSSRDGWDFDEEDYLGSGSFVQELLDTAERMGMRIFERDDRLYCYPVLVRVLASERAVRIDRTRERRLRPTVLVNQLKDLQRKPPRFRPDAFLEALYSAYTNLAGQRPKQLPNLGSVEELLKVYDLLTLLPGQSREYSRQEFARDIYLLDRSGVTTTRQGYVMSLPASTGTRSTSRTLSAIAEDGQEKVYYGISFTRSE